MKITSKKIAELSGVSRGTIDRVLYNRPGVKPEVRKKVQDIIDAFNYQPNIIGKSLASTNLVIKFGIILTPEYNPFVDEIVIGLNKAQKELSQYSIELDIRKLASLDVSEQLTIIQNLRKSKINGLALIPLDDERIVKELNNFEIDGIPVVCFNSKIDAISQLCFIGQNHYSGGLCAGHLMEKLLPLESKVAVIMSSKSLNCHINRLAGFKEGIDRKNNKIELVSVYENQDKDDKAFESVLRMFNANPSINGIYITGGGLSGVDKALKVLNKGDSIRLITHDYIEGTLPLLKNGVLDFAIGQNPERMGYIIVNTLFNFIVKHEKPETEIIDIPVEIANSEVLEAKENNYFF